MDFETQILILKEDMIQERADARQEKKRLKQAVVSVISNIIFVSSHIKMMHMSDHTCSLFGEVGI